MMRPFSDVDLHAFVDGQVTPERRALIDAYLKTNPGEAARVDQWRRQNETIRSLFAGAASEPVPLWLTIGQLAAGRSRYGGGGADPIQDNRRPRSSDTRRGSPVAPRGRRAARRMRPAAVVLLAFAAGAALPYAVPEWPRAIERLLPASPRTHQLQRVAIRTDEAHRTFDRDLAVEIADTPRGALAMWFRRHLDYPVRVPDLTRLGWSLRGGRVVTGDLGPSALMVFENGTGDRISLVETQVNNPALADTTFSVVDGPALVWLDGPVGFGLATTTPGPWLETNARALYRAVYEGGDP